MDGLKTFVIVFRPCWTKSIDIRAVQKPCRFLTVRFYLHVLLILFSAGVHNVSTEVRHEVLLEAYKGLDEFPKQFNSCEFM